MCLSAKEIDDLNKYVAGRSGVYNLDRQKVAGAVFTRLDSYSNVWQAKEHVDSVCRSMFRQSRSTAARSRNRMAAQVTGGEMCDRCDGDGGKIYWSGYTCFKCGGSGFASK